MRPPNRAVRRRVLGRKGTRVYERVVAGHEGGCTARALACRIFGVERRVHPDCGVAEEDAVRQAGSVVERYAPGGLRASRGVSAVVMLWFKTAMVRASDSSNSVTVRAWTPLVKTAMWPRKPPARSR